MCILLMTYGLVQIPPLMGEGTAYCGMPSLGPGCPVPDVDFDYFIDLYQMIEMTDTL